MSEEHSSESSVDREIADILGTLLSPGMPELHGATSKAGLWTCCRLLAGMVLDAKPIVEQDARMMADLTRFAPLSSEEQARHDSTEYPSEKWIEKFNRLAR